MKGIKGLTENEHGYIHIVDVSPDLGKRFREWTRDRAGNRMSIALTLLLDIAENNELFNSLVKRLDELEKRLASLEQAEVEESVEMVKTFGGGKL